MSSNLENLFFVTPQSSLVRFNVSLFVLSTAHPAGGLPLGVLITSAEKETTIKNGLKKYKHYQVMPFMAMDQKKVQLW